MNPDRRPLQFRSFDEIVPDVQRLLGGHRTVGRWSLGQICDHLATVNRRLVDAPAEPKPDPALRVSDEQKRQVFASGQLPEAMPMPGQLAAPADVDAAEAAERLRESLAYYRASPTGPVTEHRLFGKLSKDEWDRLVLIHHAHHLSFAIPETA